MYMKLYEECASIVFFSLTMKNNVQPFDLLKSTKLFEQYCTFYGTIQLIFKQKNFMWKPE